MKDVYVMQEVPLTIGFYENSNKSINMASCVVEFSLATYADDLTPDTQDAHQLSFDKIMTFLESVVDSSVVLYHGTETVDFVRNFVTLIDNNFIILPDSSSYTLPAALHAKLNSIISVESTVEILHIKMTGPGTTYAYVLTENDEYSELPFGTDWVSPYPHWDTPWWFRNDPLTWDAGAESEEEQLWTRDQLSAGMEELMSHFNNADTPVAPKPVKEGDLIRVDFSKRKDLPDD